MLGANAIAMSLVDMINWMSGYLHDNRFKDNTFETIKDAYIDYCKDSGIEIEDESKVGIELKACLSKLGKDGHLIVYDFLDNPTYRLKFGIGMFAPIKYKERTQEEIDDENYAKERKIEIERQIKKENRRKKIKDCLIKLWGIFVKYWYALIIPIAVLFIWEIWLKPWING